MDRTKEDRDSNSSYEEQEQKENENQTKEKVKKIKKLIQESMKDPDLKEHIALLKVADDAMESVLSIASSKLKETSKENASIQSSVKLEN